MLHLSLQSQILFANSVTASFICFRYEPWLERLKAKASHNREKLSHLEPEPQQQLGSANLRLGSRG
jgi:hypothetical protein